VQSNAPIAALNELWMACPVANGKYVRPAAEVEGRLGELGKIEFRVRKPSVWGST
jgi:hypothetical protein